MHKVVQVVIPQILQGLSSVASQPASSRVDFFREFLVGLVFFQQVVGLGEDASEKQVGGFGLLVQTAKEDIVEGIVHIGEIWCQSQGISQVLVQRRSLLGV